MVHSRSLTEGLRGGCRWGKPIDSEQHYSYPPSYNNVNALFFFWLRDLRCGCDAGFACLTRGDIAVVDGWIALR